MNDKRKRKKKKKEKGTPCLLKLNLKYCSTTALCSREGLQIHPPERAVSSKVSLSADILAEHLITMVMAKCPPVSEFQSPPVSSSWALKTCKRGKWQGRN
jgi:hypothetical protein